MVFAVIDCQLLGKIFKSGKHVTDMSRVELRFNLCNLATLYWITFIYYICKNTARLVISQRSVFAKIIDTQVIVWKNKVLEYYKIAEVYTFLPLNGCAHFMPSDFSGVVIFRRLTFCQRYLSAYAFRNIFFFSAEHRHAYYLLCYLRGPAPAA